MTGFNALDSRVDTVDEIDPRIDLYLETLYLELTCRYGTQFLHLACATAWPPGWGIIATACMLS
jgi:hypothetical protein